MTTMKWSEGSKKKREKNNHLCDLRIPPLLQLLLFIMLRSCYAAATAAYRGGCMPSPCTDRTANTSLPLKEYFVSLRWSLPASGGSFPNCRSQHVDKQQNSPNKKRSAARQQQADREGDRVDGFTSRWSVRKTWETMWARRKRFLWVREEHRGKYIWHQQVKWNIMGVKRTKSTGYIIILIHELPVVRRVMGVISPATPHPNSLKI